MSSISRYPVHTIKPIFQLLLCRFSEQFRLRESSTEVDVVRCLVRVWFACSVYSLGRGGRRCKVCGDALDDLARCRDGLYCNQLEFSLFIL